jgi:hypothetical protein
MSLLGSHLPLREGEHLRIREHCDWWGIDRGRTDRGEDQRQRLRQELGHLPMGQGRPVLRVRIEFIR